MDQRNRAASSHSGIPTSRVASRDRARRRSLVRKLRLHMILPLGFLACSTSLLAQGPSSTLRARSDRPSAAGPAQVPMKVGQNSGSQLLANEGPTQGPSTSSQSAPLQSTLSPSAQNPITRKPNAEKSNAEKSNTEKSNTEKSNTEKPNVEQARLQDSNRTVGQGRGTTPGPRATLSDSSPSISLGSQTREEPNASELGLRAKLEESISASSLEAPREERISMAESPSSELSGSLKDQGAKDQGAEDPSGQQRLSDQPLTGPSRFSSRQSNGARQPSDSIANPATAGATVPAAQSNPGLPSLGNYDRNGLGATPNSDASSSVLPGQSQEGSSFGEPGTDPMRGQFNSNTNPNGYPNEHASSSDAERDLESFNPNAAAINNNPYRQNATARNPGGYNPNQPQFAANPNGRGSMVGGRGMQSLGPLKLVQLPGQRTDEVAMRRPIATGWNRAQPRAGSDDIEATQRPRLDPSAAPSADEAFQRPTYPFKAPETPPVQARNSFPLSPIGAGVPISAGVPLGSRTARYSLQDSGLGQVMPGQGQGFGAPGVGGPVLPGAGNMALPNPSALPSYPRATSGLPFVAPGPCDYDARDMVHPANYLQSDPCVPMSGYQGSPYAYVPPTITPNMAPGMYAPDNAGWRPLFTLGQENYNAQLGRGIFGQPTAYVPGQPFRNFFRYISP